MPPGHTTTRCTILIDGLRLAPWPVRAGARQVVGASLGSCHRQTTLLTIRSYSPLGTWRGSVGFGPFGLSELVAKKTMPVVPRVLAIISRKTGTLGAFGMFAVPL